jgi:hypothetical protein
LKCKSIIFEIVNSSTATLALKRVGDNIGLAESNKSTNIFELSCSHGTGFAVSGYYSMQSTDK